MGPSLATSVTVPMALPETHRTCARCVQAKLNLGFERGQGARDHYSKGDAMKVEDPVCRMKFVMDRAAAKVEYEGKTYYFCSEGCRAEFEADPEEYDNHGSGRARRDALHGVDQS